VDILFVILMMAFVGLTLALVKICAALERRK
jgi:hypothetical protein